MVIPDYKKYLAGERLPHIWCAGCGNGIILKALLIVLAELNFKSEEILLATGIGCASRAGDYISFQRFQGTHGRTLAFVTGLKIARPNLRVICLIGDGDCAAIGIGHLIHAARRNLDVAVLVANNLNYGMTGGQFSPLTPTKSLTSTSRAGKLGATLDICRLVEVAGANYVARTSVFYHGELRKFIREAISKTGFSLVEILTPCPTYYGRYNKIGGPGEMLIWFRDKTVPLNKYLQINPEEQKEYIWRAKLGERDAPDFYTRCKNGGGPDD
jgi:2-oxoglutarate ferredoxin oxidoreductase subunit beta